MGSRYMQNIQSKVDRAKMQKKKKNGKDSG